jgi:RHS repeat-associated protein
LENRDLVQALLAYRDAVRNTGSDDAVEPLLGFLSAHPTSPWKPALQLNLGMLYRRTGHFSKALATWQAAWNDARALNDPHGRALANAMVANLSQTEAYLGRKELLQPLLASIRDRPVGGTAAQLLTDSHTGLARMLSYPGESFLCGPLALMRILKYRNAHPSPNALHVLEQATSTDHGLSLTMVQGIAAQAGMNYQMAFRTPGAAIILPAVAHWKVGHYAAVVDRVNRHYLVQDTTFGDDVRVSPATLDEEASGYFLVPAGPLPDGWRAVSAAEGTKVWGRGDAGNNHDGTNTGPTACDDCSANRPAKGGGYTSSDVELQVVGLELHDMPVGYTPPLGPAVHFDVYYSHRDMLQPTIFSYTNFGPKWTFSWLRYVTDNVNSSASASVYLRGGGAEPYTFSSTSATTAYPGPYSQAILTRTVNGSGSSTGFTLTYPDGSTELFDQASGNQFFMTAVGDPAGNYVLINYDSQMRITTITDAIGETSTLSYGLPGSPLVVTAVTDPFGRSATFTYNSAGQLASITDVLGITSSYNYGQGSDTDFINTLTTPYGSTTFTYGDSSTNPNLPAYTRFLITTDPLGRTSYVEYATSALASDGNPNLNQIYSQYIPSGMSVCNSLQQIRNTFVFDANQYAAATAGGSLNYSLGKAIHWLRTDNKQMVMRVKESEKEPLENRVWYNYPTEASGCNGEDASQFPVDSNYVVTNGASNKPSVIGRVLDNGATQLETFQYNSNGNVIQATDAIGRQLSFAYAANGIDRLTTTNTTNGTTQLLQTRTYNSKHLPLTITGTNGMTAHFQYNGGGEPTRYTDQLGHATAMSYDSSGRLKSLTGPINTAKYTFAYDTVSRISSVTDPGGLTVHFTYDAADRPTGATYPDGTKTSLSYTLLDLTKFTDRLRQTTTYRYDADRELVSTTDPMAHVIQQGYNLAGQLNSITDANNHTTTFVLDDQGRTTSKQFANGTSVTIAYQSALSLVATVTDALSQTTDYTYNLDNTLATISYVANQPTSSVSFAYDAAYPRVVSMTDGVGTTSYTYFPVSSPGELGANQLNSVTSPIAGTSNSDTITYTYDAMDRIVGYAVNGAAQSIAFDALGRITSAINGLDSFAYYYADGTARVSEVTSTHGPQTALTYFGPSGDELLQELNVATHGGVRSLEQFGYTYNADNNVTSVSLSSPSQATNYGYDGANRLISGSSPAYSYGYDHASNLTSMTVNGTQKSLSYTSINEITPANYDANGSPTALGGNSYTWDGANRIVSFSNAAAHTGSSFTYDGLGRVVRIVDSKNGAVIGDHSYFWCGTVQCLAHDNTQSNSPVTKQYFPQGVIASGTPYYYVQDELGSVVQLVTSGGNVAAQYSYDPYGNRSVVSGTVVSDVGYAGYFYHANSGLDLAMYRAYDPAHGRWLNRDPIGEEGGVNLYAYADGNPASEIDPTGLLGMDNVYEFVYSSTGGWSPSQGTVSFWGGFGDTLSFNLTNAVRNRMGTNDLVNKCSGFYTLGEAAGIALTTALGGAAGAEAAGARAGKAGYEFSHWIPARVFRPTSQSYSPIVDNLFGWAENTSLNGNYVSQEFHYLTDAFRYPSGWQGFGDRLPAAWQQLGRIPWVYWGGAAGAAYGGASIATGSKCGCQK